MATPTTTEEDIEEICTSLNAEGNVEGCWTLRGCLDNALSRPRDYDGAGSGYLRYYLAGYSAAEVGQSLTTLEDLSYTVDPDA